MVFSDPLWMGKHTMSFCGGTGSGPLNPILPSSCEIHAYDDDKDEVGENCRRRTKTLYYFLLSPSFRGKIKRYKMIGSRFWLFFI